MINTLILMVRLVPELPCNGGLEAGHLRLSYNKAFQTPSLYNLHFLYHALPIGGAPVPLDPNGILINPNDPRTKELFMIGS